MARQLKLSIQSISIFIVLGGLFAPAAFAEEVVAGSVFDESKESEIVQKARHHAYPGGRDDSDLTVQSQLMTPTRKITPQMENAENPADD
ncbi:MAG: hypothetical protein ACXVB4_12205 [Pseudobdellovibrionaceae bacterium]